MNDKRDLTGHSRAWFDDHLAEYLTDLEELVSIPSISSAPEAGEPFGRECQRVLAAGCRILEKHGFAGQLDSSRAFLTCQASPAGARSLGIFSHLDVVPIGDPADWRYPPFAVSRQNDFLIGRGVGDNKGPALLLLYVLRYLRQQGVDLKYGLQLFWGINEENGMRDIREYLTKYPEPQIAFTPDADFPVCIGEKGIIEAQLEYDFSASSLLTLASGEVSNSVADWAEATFRITGETHIASDRIPEHITLQLADANVLRVRAKGKSTHAAFPEGSINAVVELAKFLLTTSLCDEPARRLMAGIVALLEDYYGSGLDLAHQSAVFGPLTVAGGFSVSEDKIYRQNLNIRTAPEITAEEVLRSLTRAAGAWGFTAQLLNSSAGFYHSPEAPWIQAMLKAIRTTAGGAGPAVPYVMGGATYSRRLKHCVGFGPGNKAIRKPADLGNGHQPDECIALQALREAFAVYVSYLLELDAMEEWEN